jgi:hypothetical protein
MVTEWEYTRVGVHITPMGLKLKGRGLEGRSIEGQASADWVELLNEKGEDGWELISEQFSSGGTPPGEWAGYSGTMKRPSRWD